MENFKKILILTCCTLFCFPLGSISIIYSNTSSIKNVERSNGQNAFKKNSFWIQVKASESKDSIGKTVDSLNVLSIPNQISTTKKSGKTFYRIRIGPFKDSLSTTSFGNFLNLQKPWIVKTPYDSNIQLINSIYLDTINIVNKKVGIVSNKNCDIFSLYVHTFGSELSVLPSNAYVYMLNNNSIQKVDLKAITGILVTDTAIIYGKADKLFFNPDGIGEENFKSDIESYVKSHNLKYSVVQDSILYFNDGQDGYYTRQGILSFFNSKCTIYDKLGFDYVDSNSKMVSYKGEIGNKAIGNFLIKPVNKETMFSYSCKKINIYLKSTNGEDFTIFILIKDKE